MHDLTAIDCSPQSPLRPLDWRWRMAVWVAQGNRWAPRRPDDPDRTRAIALARLTYPMVGPRLAKKPRPDPACVEALRIHHQVHDLDRLVLQARLLAGQDDATIAARMARPEAVIAAYAALFYDVRSILARPDTIMQRAIGTRAYDEDGGGPEIALKLMAYQGGPWVVDDLLGSHPGDPSILNPNSAGDEPSLAASFRLVVDVRALPTEGREAIKVLRLHEIIERMDREGADLGGLALSLARPLAIPSIDSTPDILATPDTELAARDATVVMILDHGQGDAENRVTASSSAITPAFAMPGPELEAAA